MNYSPSNKLLIRLSLLVLLPLGMGLSPLPADSEQPQQAQEPGQCGQSLGLTPTTVAQGLSGDLEILSWNIQKSSNEGWQEDLARLAGNTQLTFIQEATVRAGLASTIPGGQLFEAFTEGYKTDTLHTGVMTLSSQEPSLHCSFKWMEPWLRTPKAATVTEHPLAGREDRLLTINVHSVNFAWGLKDYHEQLRPLAALLAQHQGPAILAGDFNTWSSARLRLLNQLLGEQGLKSVEFHPDLRTTTFGNALDHIYVRGLHAQHTEVIPVSSSDHNALRARLRLNDVDT